MSRGTILTGSVCLQWLDMISFPCEGYYHYFLDEFDIGHCWIKDKVTTPLSFFSIYHNIQTVNCYLNIWNMIGI